MTKDAIAFDLDTTLLSANYHNASYNNAYKEIEAVLGNHGLVRQQGSVYFGDASVNAVTCAVAMMDLADLRERPWFSASVRDVRMLRIEDDNDLMPVVERVAPRQLRRRVG